MSAKLKKALIALVTALALAAGTWFSTHDSDKAVDVFHKNVVPAAESAPSN